MHENYNRYQPKHYDWNLWQVYDTWTGRPFGNPAPQIEATLLACEANIFVLHLAIKSLREQQKELRKLLGEIE